MFIKAWIGLAHGQELDFRTKILGLQPYCRPFLDILYLESVQCYLCNERTMPETVTDG